MEVLSDGLKIIRVGIPVAELAVHRLPSGSRVVDVHYHPGYGVCLIVLSSGSSEYEEYSFPVRRTGDVVPRNAKHLKSLALPFQEFLLS